MDHLGTRVDGLIINGVFKSKIDKIRESLEGYYDHIFLPLYGPYLHQPFPPILGLCAHRYQSWRCPPCG